MRAGKINSNNTPVLTRHETRILEMLAQGFSAHAIASMSFLSLDRVESLMKSISQKLSTKNMMDAVEQALRMGLIKQG